MDSKKITISIIAVMLIAIVIAGGTYAFWYWQSDAGNQTAVNFVISRPGFTITGNNVSSSSLVPTTNCAHSTYAMMGNATVSATNDTSATMRATITLKGRLTPQSGRTLSNADKGHIHWAIKEVESASVSTYATANCSAASTANSASYTTGIFTDIGATYTDIATTITFDVNPNGSATKYYQVYAWIDSGYTYTTTGGAATDPMQGLTVDLTFSETSSFTQNIPTVVEDEGPFYYTLDYFTAGQTAPVDSDYYHSYDNRNDIVAEAMSYFDLPMYIKYKVENGYVTNTYVEFEITNSFVTQTLNSCAEASDQEYRDMCVNKANDLVPGIYTLKAGDASVYNRNISIIQNAFGAENCQDQSEGYQCDSILVYARVYNEDMEYGISFTYNGGGYDCNATPTYNFCGSY